MGFLQLLQTRLNQILPILPYCMLGEKVHTVEKLILKVLLLLVFAADLMCHNRCFVADCLLEVAFGLLQ